MSTITYNWEPLRRLRLSSSGTRTGWDTGGATAGADDESNLIIFSSSAAS